jgi:nucleotide-binding universal stress UspA family protein
MGIMINIDEVVSQMPKVKKILVSVDGSSVSIRGVVHAVQLAKVKNAELIALFVDTSYMDMDTKGYGAYALLKDRRYELDVKGIDSKEVVDILEKHFKRVVKPASVVFGEVGLEVAELIAERQGVKLKTMIERGEAPQTIVKIAKEENVDMIVIGSHGLRGFNKILLGSVAESVSKLASCPVLIVKPESEN